jgi:hypothetical protein
MGESYGKNGRDKLFFGFNFNVLWRSKKSSFHVHELGHMDKTLETNFCFGLVCKAVVEVQRNYILFTYVGVPDVQKKTRGSSSNFVNLFHEFIPCIPFVHPVLLVFLLLCAM